MENFEELYRSRKSSNNTERELIKMNRRAKDTVYRMFVELLRQKDHVYTTGVRFQWPMITTSYDDLTLGSNRCSNEQGT
jgi:hypothetical protein